MAVVFLTSPSATSVAMPFAGCARISPGPTCDLDPDEPLFVWAAGRTLSRVEATLDGTPLSVETSTAAGGVRLKLETLKPGRLVVAVEDEDGLRVSTLKLSAHEPADVPPDMLTVLKKGDFAQIKQWAGAHPGRSAARAYIAMSVAARANGDVKKAVEHLAAAASEAHSANEWSLEAKARFARSYNLAFGLYDLEGAQREFDNIEPLVERVPDVGAYLPYYRALVDQLAGDITSSLENQRLAATRGNQLGLEVLVHLVEELLAGAERELGYFDVAIGRYRRMMRWAESTDDRACEEAQAATNLGWTLILKQSLSPNAVTSPLPPLRRALRLYSGDCDEPGGVAVVRMNLAYATLQSNRFDEAAGWLATIDEEGLSGQQRLWLAETRTRIRLMQRDFGFAEGIAKDLLDEAKKTGGFDIRFRAYVLYADVLTGLGRFDEALEVRLQAEETLDRLAMSVPLVGARHSFLSIRDDNVLGLAELLVRQNRPADALKAIRRARSRSLGWARVSQGLAQLDGPSRAEWNARLGEYRRLRTELDTLVEKMWRFSKAQLQVALKKREDLEEKMTKVLDHALRLLPSIPNTMSADPDVLRLSWIRLGSRIMVLGQLGNDAFALPWAEGTTVVPVEVGRRLKFAKRVLLHPYGALRDLDLHMLEWNGQPLAAQRVTAYALDLSTSGGVARPTSALIVVDPEAELAGGQEEDALVGEALQRDGATVTRVRGDVAEVQQGLATADWFHFGGHGGWRPDDPMSGGLELADGARFGIGDILAAPRVPATVVLASCEAGRGAGKGGESFGLAHAFLVGGARAVVAPKREVLDEEAVRFARAFYESDGTAAERYRGAVEKLGAASAPFTVFVP